MSKEKESPDAYLARLVNEAAPAWDGVDPQQFLDEVRGRSAELEWKMGAPENPGTYVMATKYWPIQLFIITNLLRVGNKAQLFGTSAPSRPFRTSSIFSY